MCNLYNLTSGPQAIREFTRAVLDDVGNLEPGKGGLNSEVQQTGLRFQFGRLQEVS